jgi:hypothetical protein
MERLSNGDTEGGARVLRECFWGTANASTDPATTSNERPPVDRVELIERLYALKDSWRDLKPGVCKMFSLGDDCRCALCVLDMAMAVARASHEPRTDLDTVLDNWIAHGKMVEAGRIPRTNSYARLIEEIAADVRRAAQPPGEGWYTMSQISYALNRSLYAKTGNLAIEGIIEDLHAALKNGGDHPARSTSTKGGE